MSAPAPAAPDTLDALRTENAALRDNVAELQAKLQWYEEQYRLAKQRQFGASSERTPEEQRALVFNEAEAEASAEPPAEPTLDVAPHQRRKTRRSRGETVANLPVDIVRHELPESEQSCATCGGHLHAMSVEISRKLIFIPAQARVEQTERVVYACRACERDAVSTPPVTAPAPSPAFPGSLASPSAVAHIAAQKFVEGLPLYRQEQAFRRQGLDLSRQVLAHWMLMGAELAQPLYDRLHDILVTRDILHADETTLQVLQEAGRAADTKSYLWCYRTGRDGPPLVLYDYTETRAGAHPKAFLDGFRGFLHVDGYAAYEGLGPEITLVGCWAHARRGFSEALAALPPEHRDADPPVAARVGLDFCNRLFTIERDLHDVSAQERHDGRLARSRPVLNGFQAWLARTAQAALPKSALGRAVGYCTNQWPKLTAFLQDGRLELDNNRTERSIKPVVIGRKNWLFANTPRGARSSAVLYSLVETAKANALDPYHYLTHLFTALPDTRTGDLDALLPWSDALPAACRVPSRPGA